MIKAILTMAAMLSTGAGAPPPSPAALAPVGPWEVKGDTDGVCMLSRNYGAADNPVIVAFQPLPNQPMMEVMVLSKSDSDAARHGVAYMTLGAGSLKGVGGFTSFKVPHSTQRLTRFTIDRTAFDGLAGADTVTLDADTAVTIAIKNGKGAMAALDACEVKLLTAWGIDPNSFGPGKPAPMPKGGASGAQWFSNNDYPDAAKRANISGRVVMVLTVGEDGMVTACRVVASGGAILDRTSCALATRRARFTPAIDAAGKPMVSWAIIPIRWSLG
jgi:TonB family protein